MLLARLTQGFSARRQGCRHVWPLGPYLVDILLVQMDDEGCDFFAISSQAASSVQTTKAEIPAKSNDMIA